MSIRPKQTVELELTDGKRVTQHLRTLVHDVHKDTVTITEPKADDGTPVPIPVKTSLILRYTDFRPVTEGRYWAAAQVKKLEKAEPERLLVLGLKGIWQRIQQREFVRVDVALQGRYGKVVEGKVLPTQSCDIRNLSGGGLMFQTPEKLKKGTDVHVEIALASGTILVKGKIIRVPYADANYVSYCINFTTIEEQDRQVVIQYVFDRQLTLRKKGVSAVMKDDDRDEELAK